ncbi:hypothetical protein HAX54_046590, partial [Datura stramonium]|nr:hypothetical protein [Datura stramonium]
GQQTDSMCPELTIWSWQQSQSDRLGKKMKQTVALPVSRSVATFYAMGMTCFGGCRTWICSRDIPRVEPSGVAISSPVNVVEIDPKKSYKGWSFAATFGDVLGQN